VGRAIALELARGGFDLAIHYHRSRAEAEELVSQIAAKGRRAVAIAGDLTDPASWPAIIQQVVERLNRLDVLINNAADFSTDDSDSVESFNFDRWQSMLRVNLMAPMALCHHARTHLAAGGQGKIVNLCDTSGDRPWPGHLAYCASKAALSALTKGLALALAPRIQVNGVAPGIAVFPEDYSPEVRRDLVHRVPLGREGTPAEVAALVRYLVESGHYITGQIIPIDGGRSLV
jgi:pteridine reductase